MAANREILDYLQSLPGFPVQTAQSIQQIDSPAGGDAALYGDPSTYRYTPPAQASSARLVRTHGGLINPAETQASIIRATEEDYQRRFAPIEDRFVRETLREGAGVQMDLARTDRAVRDAAANVAGQRRRAMGRYGIAREIDPHDSNATVSTAVGAKRDTRIRAEDRRMRALGGVGGTVAQSRSDLAVGGN